MDPGGRDTKSGGGGREEEQEQEQAAEPNYGKEGEKGAAADEMRMSEATAIK